MSQLGGAKPDATALHWCDGGTPYTKTPPSEGKKDTGWAFKQLVPYDELNWRWFNEYLWLKWLYDVVPSEFSTLAEAIPLVAVPRTFRVHPPDAGMKNRLTELLSVQGLYGSYAIGDVVTDGEQIYYCQTQYCYAVNPETGAQNWDWHYVVGDIDRLAADGFRTYVGGDNGVVYLLDPSDGSQLTTASTGTGGPFAGVVANGEWLVSAVGNVAYFHDTLGGTPVLQGNYDHGDAINALAIDATAVYLGGTRGSGSSDLRRINLSAQSSDWAFTFPTTSAPTINSITCDGDFVFVGTSLVGLSAGGSATLFCYGAYDHALKWTYYTTTQITHVTVDDRYVYASNDADRLYMFDKRNGHWIDYLGDTTTFHAFAADGISVIGSDGSDYLRRYARGGPTRTFMRSAGTDPNRRPFHNLAIPIGEGI